MLEYLWRVLTDKRVNCAKCWRKIGYVCREGHTRWLCAYCGGGDTKAI